MNVLRDENYMYKKIGINREEERTERLKYKVFQDLLRGCVYLKILKLPVKGIWIMENCLH